jgi:hypothetical protein
MRDCARHRRSSAEVPAPDSGYVLRFPVGSRETDVSALKDKVFPLIMAKLDGNNYPEVSG